MKIQYFKSTDTLYIEFSRGAIVETRDLDEDTVIDLDASGRICSALPLSPTARWAAVS